MIFFNKLIVVIIFFSVNGCSKESNISQELQKTYPKSVSFSVKNESRLDKKDAIISIDVEDLKMKAPQINLNAFVIICDGDELPSQANDIDADGIFDEVITICDVKADKKKTIMLRYTPNDTLYRQYSKRTQAELSHKFGGKFIKNKKGRLEYDGGEFKNVQYLFVPPEHTDHTFFVRYEGPGWESDKVGYRFYLDWRNAIDIFGKKTPAMVLQKVGQDGFDSYHEMSDWGMDILKVGDALGIGSIGLWYEDTVQRVSDTDSTDCRIVANGAVQSAIRTNYYGWKVGEGIYNLKSDLSIHAGSRLTKHQVTMDSDPENLCTGLVKHPDVELFQGEKDQLDWSYLATYGQQSLAGDKLGMAVLYRKKDLLKITEDNLNHVVVLKPDRKQLTYYFLAAWEQEPVGIRNIDEFKSYLNQTLYEINNPLILEF